MLTEDDLIEKGTDEGNSRTDALMKSILAEKFKSLAGISDDAFSTYVSSVLYAMWCDITTELLYLGFTYDEFEERLDSLCEEAETVEDSEGD